MKHYVKKLTAVALVAVLSVAGSVTIASAKTVKYNDGSKWVYGATSKGVTVGDESNYYRPDYSTHSAKVTLDNGEYKYACAYGDKWVGSNGWAKAYKTNIWNGVTYSKANNW